MNEKEYLELQRCGYGWVLVCARLSSDKFRTMFFLISREQTKPVQRQYLEKLRIPMASWGGLSLRWFSRAPWKGTPSLGTSDFDGSRTQSVALGLHVSSQTWVKNFDLSLGTEPRAPRSRYRAWTRLITIFGILTEILSFVMIRNQLGLSKNRNRKFQQYRGHTMKAVGLYKDDYQESTQSLCLARLTLVNE